MMSKYNPASVNWRGIKLKGISGSASGVCLEVMVSMSRDKQENMLPQNLTTAP